MYCVLIFVDDIYMLSVYSSDLYCVTDVCVCICVIENPIEIFESEDEETTTGIVLYLVK